MPALATNATHAEVLPNGLVLLVESMPDVQSASFSLMTPAGSIYEPSGANGVASILTELISRGAGARNSRELAAALDMLGVQRTESVGWNFITFSGATLADNLPATLDIYADIILRPKLPADEFDAAREGVEQSLLAIEDEPQRKAMIELRRRSYDAPWGLPTDGSLDDLPNITQQTVTDHYRQNFRPSGTILAIAGNVDAGEVQARVRTLFGGWQPRPAPNFTRGAHGERIGHVLEESAQTQIGIAFASVPYSHPDYYAAWAAASVLGGGSSSRLFTEVRERRGLCYSVYSSHNSLLTEGRIFVYAGTTAERAQETLDVTLQELRRLADGIDADELERCKARAKSALIMQQESTASRAGSIARDWFHLERVISPQELHRIIDELTPATVVDYIRRFPPSDLTILTMGPDPLRINA